MLFNPKLKKPDKKTLNKLAQAGRYSGLAFEMAAIILAGVFGGIWLDKRFETSALFTLLLSVFAVFAAIYFVIKDLLRPNDTPKK